MWLGAEIRISPEVDWRRSDPIVTRTVCALATTNCLTTTNVIQCPDGNWYENGSCNPGWITNWWVLSYPGYSGSGPGVEVRFTPTNCGAGSVTFYGEWGHRKPWNENEWIRGGLVSISTNFTVMAVASLVPDLPPDQGGLESGSDPPTYWVCPCDSGDVIVTASSCPELPTDQLPDCWTFTGGIEIDKLRHKVNKAELLNGPVTFTVSAGASSKTIILKADEEKEIYSSHIPQQECLYDNFNDPSPSTDKCGNSVSVNCVGGVGWPLYRPGHYEYYWNTNWVGTCYFNGGENVFLFKTTKHNCLILRTWHLTQEPTTPTRWVVTKSGPSQNCRTAPAWDSSWARPADELVNKDYPAKSCENQGTPFTPCPPW